MTNKKNKSKTINPEKEDGQKKIAEAVILEKKISPRGRIFEGIVKKKLI